MKNIGIINLNYINNYENRIQNYAVQYSYEKMNLKVETIKNNTYDYENRSIKYYLRLFSITKVYQVLKRKLNLIISKHIKNKVLIKRRGNFLEFEKYINYSENIITNNFNTNILNDKYDFFSIGSDQVWNPQRPTIKEINFLEFAPKEKNISFSASIGVNDIPKEYIDIYKKGFENISAISVREERSVELVKEISGKEAVLVVDPTMMLTDKEWDKVSKNPEYIPEKKYILTYFLGKYSRARKKYIYDIAKKNNFEVVDLGQIRIDKYYIAGPSEFLWYIKNAEMVFTDSFHGTVFSILYKRPFYVLDREQQGKSMSSRLDTILKKFNLENRKLTSYDKEVEFNIDFSNTDNILKEEREKAMNFLKNSLGIGE